MKTFCTCLIFLALLSQASAQSVIDRQLQTTAVILNNNGYELSHDLKYASLYDDDSDYYTFTLDGGSSYKIVAVCDGDCEDLDLKLYDENYNLIDSDMDTDDNPVVSVTPKWTGRFRVWVKMEDCRINPCRFAIAIFEQ